MIPCLLSFAAEPWQDLERTNQKVDCLYMSASKPKSSLTLENAQGLQVIRPQILEKVLKDSEHQNNQNIQNQVQQIQAVQWD